MSALDSFTPQKSWIKNVSTSPWNSEDLPTLPTQYQKPHVPGVVRAHPNQSKPLMKIMGKMLMKPKLRSLGKHTQPIKKKKTVIYY